jgi:tetratricopeptide (TPR) repeat protein
MSLHQVKVYRLRLKMLAPVGGAAVDFDEVLREAQEIEPEVMQTQLGVEHQFLCGAAEAAAGRVKDAIIRFRKVLAIISDSDAKQRAECHLRLANAYEVDGNFVSAREHLREWHKLAGVVENAYLHRYAVTIESEITTAFQPFVIRCEDDLTWANCERNLKQWLAKTASARAQLEDPSAPGKAVASILGINASSWSRWQVDLKRKP